MTTAGALIKAEAEAVSAGSLLSPAGRFGVSLKGGCLLLSRP